MAVARASDLPACEMGLEGTGLSLQARKEQELAKNQESGQPRGAAAGGRVSVNLAHRRGMSRILLNFGWWSRSP